MVINYSSANLEKIMYFYYKPQQMSNHHNLNSLPSEYDNCDAKIIITFFTILCSSQFTVVNSFQHGPLNQSAL